MLGSVGIEHPDGAPEPIGSVRLRRALAVLTINVGSVVSVDRLTDLLWIDNHPAHPDAALHTVVSRLRTRLGAAGLTGRLLTKAPGYVLQLSRLECDATRFTDLVDRAVASIDDDPAGAVERLDAAQSLWRGTPYGEFCDEEFAAADVARLTEYRALAAESRTAAVLALGRPAEAITLAEQAIAMSPLRERPRAQLMTALYRAGRQPEAQVSEEQRRALGRGHVELTGQDHHLGRVVAQEQRQEELRVRVADEGGEGAAKGEQPKGRTLLKGRKDHHQRDVA